MATVQQDERTLQHDAIRAAVRDICKDFPDSYWRDVDQRHEYPQAFVQALTEAGSVLARGAQEVSQEVFGFVQERARKNADAVNQIARVRSVHDFVAVQSDLARDRLEQVIEINKRVAETSLRIAEEAGRVIQAQANRRLRAA